MSNVKKWMVVLTNEQYEWIKETADKAGVSGAAVCRTLIGQAMEQNSSEFRRNLMSAQIKSELEGLEEKKARIAEQEKELRLKLGSRERVVA
jgi:hypothetical protein